MGFIIILHMSIPINPKFVFVIVPAFNENAVINSVIEDVSKPGYTIVLVDDGSEISLLSAIKKKSIIYLRHKINLGQGAALQTGIEYALERNAEYVVTFDADGQHDANDIEKLLNPIINNKADIAFGSRFIDGSTQNMPKGRNIIIQLARIFNFLITGFFLSDAHNGMRAMNKKAATLINLKENGMAHASEILSQVKINKLRFCEVPVNIKYTVYSTKKGQNIWSSFRILFDIILNKFFK